MTTNLLVFRPIGIRPSASAGTGHRKSDPQRHYRPWWKPCPPNKITEGAQPNPNSDSNSAEKAAGSRFSPGGLTAEKARQLRIMTSKTDCFQDGMYHSGVASRLASDFSNTKNDTGK
ncbi:hypothetical protein SDJN02_08753, partial [Cucurbita argyrosperma subsp. argyrosperma]